MLLVRKRAVENRRFIIRATNDGITASIDPAGRILRKLPLYQEVAALLPFDSVRSTTPYTQHGDWFAWSCLLIGVWLSLQTQLASRIRRSAS
jgi:apolipoprotein N-acyltransferase